MAVFINRQAPQSGIASLLALQGRGGDTELVHMTKPEVNRLRNSGLMSVNPDTGLPEYFLGDVFDTVKASVKNYFKPENLIPAIASVALPAIAGPAFGGTAFGQFVGPAASQAILSGTGTALGSLPFRSPSDALSAGIVSGGMQYGGSKLREFLGSGNEVFGIDKDDGTRTAEARALGEAARANYLKGLEAEKNYIDPTNELDFGDDLGDTITLADFSAAAAAPSQQIQLQNQKLQALLTQQAATPKEVLRLGRGIQSLSPDQITQATGFTQATPVQTRAFIEGAKPPDAILDPSLDQAQRIARAAAIENNQFVTPESFDRFSEARSSFREGNYLDAAKEFGSELDFGDFGRSLSSVEATGLVDAVELQRLAQEREAQRLIESGVPEPIARRRVARRRASGEFGTGGTGLTAAEAKRRAIEGGGFEFFGPTQFVSAAQGGLVSLGHGGQTDFEGIVGGDGHGMEDNQIMGIKGGGLLAVSPKEYVVPADVMAMIGNGNPDDGADDMDKFIADFRQKKYGRDKQPPEMDGGKALQSLMS